MRFKVYKETEKTWIVLSKVPMRYIGEFKSLKIAIEVCGFYNKKGVTNNGDKFKWYNT